MVIPGIHTIYVKDKNSCGTVSLEKFLLLDFLNSLAQIMMVQMTVGRY